MSKQVRVSNWTHTELTKLAAEQKWSMSTIIETLVQEHIWIECPDCEERFPEEDMRNSDLIDYDTCVECWKGHHGHLD